MKLNVYRNLLRIVISAFFLVGTSHATSRQSEAQCLAEAVYREARGEDYRGRLAVAQVVINRTRTAGYPKTICEVVIQPGQFSWTAEPWGWSADRASWAVARIALMGTHSLSDFRAIYFHNNTVKPLWIKNKQFIAKIGNHFFYA